MIFKIKMTMFLFTTRAADDKINSVFIRHFSPSVRFSIWQHDFSAMWMAFREFWRFFLQQKTTDKIFGLFFEIIC